MVTKIGKLSVLNKIGGTSYGGYKNYGKKEKTDWSTGLYLSKVDREDFTEKVPSESRLVEGEGGGTHVNIWGGANQVKATASAKALGLVQQEQQRGQCGWS